MRFLDGPYGTKVSITGRKLALASILALALDTILALRTFKTRLAFEGMSAHQALARASVWEAGHILVVAGLLPGCVFTLTWVYLRGKRIMDWTTKRIFVVWISVPVAFYFDVLVETVMAETILPLDNAYILPLARGLCYMLVAAAVLATLYWLLLRYPAGMGLFAALCTTDTCEHTDRTLRGDLVGGARGALQELRGGVVGHASDGPSRPNQMNQEVQAGAAPSTIDRVDRAHGPRAGPGFRASYPFH